MNSLDGLSYTSNNLSGLSVGNFDNINSVTFQTEIPNQNILYLQGLTGNVQQQIDNVAGGGSSIPSISYDSSTNTTTFSGALSFPSNSIASASIINSDFVTLSTSQTISNKEFSGTAIFSSIQLGSSLILNNGGLTLSDLQLQKINFLENITSDLNTRLNSNESNISSVQLKTTQISYNSTVSTTTFSNRVIFNSTPTMAQSLRIDNSVLVGNGGNITILK